MHPDASQASAPRPSAVNAIAGEFVTQKFAYDGGRQVMGISRRWLPASEPNAQSITAHHARSFLDGRLASESEPSAHRCGPQCSTLSAMADRPNPVLRKIEEEVSLVGTMAIYNTQAEASEGIPQQWRAFLRTHPAAQSSPTLYGASPCTGDRKIHYLTGIAADGTQAVAGAQRLTLEPGEYAFVLVNEEALLRDTWTWLLNDWLITSGRREKQAPEFERYTGISDAGKPVGPVEIWIPLEPLPGD